MRGRISRGSRRRACRGSAPDRGPRRKIGMPSFRTTRRVRHTPGQMFDLVADVEKYPLFLPLCEALRVRSRTPGENGKETLIADMSVGYKAIHETFTSKVTLHPA